MNWIDGHDQFIEQLMEGSKKMKMFEYYLIEKTVRCIVVEAEDQEGAENQIQDMLDSGEVDWGLGDMEYDYHFAGEVHNE